jgi:zinc transporter ZupT
MTNANFWLQVGFCVEIFFESFLTGLIPTWSKSCRQSPAIMGIANSFAGGVFLAIALVHILPE